MCAVTETQIISAAMSALAKRSTPKRIAASKKNGKLGGRPALFKVKHGANRLNNKAKNRANKARNK